MKDLKLFFFAFGVVVGAAKWNFDIGGQSLAHNNP